MHGLTCESTGGIAPVQVLIADDSALMRHMLRKVLTSHPFIRVAGEARHGREAVEKAVRLKPDVLVLDVEMPELDGISALRQIMAERPLPVVMFSCRTKRGEGVTMEALSLGAVDFMPKPELRVNVDSVADELCNKIMMAAKARPRSPGSLPVAVHVKGSVSARRRDAATLIVIGSSAGGPQALESILPVLPGQFAGSVLVCQHMPPGFTASLARRLDALSALKVREAAHGDRLLQGTVLIAPGGYHLRIGDAGDGSTGHVVGLDPADPVRGVRPSVDVTLADAWPLFRERLLAVILTGMGLDGVRGAWEARGHGATVLCQDRDTSVVWGMPGACVEAGVYDYVLPLESIHGFMADFAARQTKGVRPCEGANACQKYV